MSDFQAAIHILQAPSIDERMQPCIKPFERAINWTQVEEAARTFSDGEIMLVNCAFALWSGRSDAFIGDPHLHSPTIPHLLHWLDADGIDRVLEAIGLKRGVTM